MAKLNHEATKRMFSVTTEEELKALVAEEGFDLDTISRMAIDEVLKKLYKKSAPSAKKEKAIEILKGAMEGKDVTDDSSDEFIASNAELISDKLGMTPDERMAKIKEFVNEYMANNKDFFCFLRVLLKEESLKKLKATADDVKFICKDNEQVAYCLESSKKGAPYIIKRTPENCDQIVKWGNTIVH